MGKSKERGKERIVKEVLLPEGVKASIDDKLLLINGPKGKVIRVVKLHKVSIKLGDNKIIIESESSSKISKKLIGSLTAHVKNMIRGSLENHNYILKICSGHFPMSVSVVDSKLIVKNFLGEKVPRVLRLKENADVKVEGDLISVKSTSKEIAGQVAADIEQLTRRPGYDTRIFQDGCYLINKDGKELK